jgi:hypothetical protein
MAARTILGKGKGKAARDGEVPCVLMVPIVDTSALCGLVNWTLDFPYSDVHNFPTS